MEAKENDLPKSIVVILVVLAVAISLLGTFTVLNEMNSVYSAPEYARQPQLKQTGEIKLTVEDPYAPGGGMAKTTGEIILFYENTEVK